MRTAGQPIHKSKDVLYNLQEPLCSEAICHQIPHSRWRKSRENPMPTGSAFSGVTPMKMLGFKSVPQNCSYVHINQSLHIMKSYCKKGRCKSGQSQGQHAHLYKVVFWSRLGNAAHSIAGLQQIVMNLKFFSAIVAVKTVWENELY